MRPEDAGAARVIGPIESVRLMASYAEPVPPMSRIFEPTPVRTDFHTFSHLWAHTTGRSSARPPVFSSSKKRRYQKVLAIGQVMGSSHGKLFWLWDDAHEGNMGWTPSQGLVIFDFTPGRFLYSTPTPAQCATTFVPLMMSFSPVDWPAFRKGYIDHRGADGERVMDLIELGDLTGWMQAFRRDDWAEAAQLMSLQFAADADLHSPPPHLQTLVTGHVSGVAS